MTLLHKFSVHSPSPLVSQVTTVAGLTLHFQSGVDLSQNNVPLHKLVSFCAAHPASCVQEHEFTPERQTPNAQTSPLVHKFPSSQAKALLVCSQPFLLLQVSLVQALPSSQNTNTLTAKPTQLPPAHASNSLHSLPSSQGNVLPMCVQPSLALQISMVQRFLSSQLAAAPLHLPPSQVSANVQALPSSHGFLLLLAMHLPLALSHFSSVHGLSSLQTFCLPGTQASSRQASPTVHGSSSVQPLPGTELCEQPSNALQPSNVQALLSSQSTAVPPPQLPLAQDSPTVHRLKSLHWARLGECKQPKSLVHKSSVHGLMSSQLTATPLQT